MSVCWPTLQLAAAKALYAEMHHDKPFHDGTFEHWSEKRTRDYPFRYDDDGVTFWLSPVDLPEKYDWLGQGSTRDPGQADESG